MDSGIIIRHAALEDLDAFRALRLEALKNHPTAFGQDHTEAESRDRAYWENRLKVDPIQDALYFAEADSQIVGMTGIHRGMGKKAMHTAFVWGVYIKPGRRGRRISKSLIEACLGWAKEQGVVIVKLAVVTENVSAIRCYERCGFKTYGTEPKAIFHDGKYYDEYLMSIDVT